MVLEFKLQRNTLRLIVERKSNGNANINEIEWKYLPLLCLVCSNQNKDKIEKKKIYCS